MRFLMGKRRWEKLSNRSWMIALFVVFLILDVAWGTFLTRLPTFQESFDLSLSGVSVLILVSSAGAVCGLVVAAKLLNYFSEPASVLAGLVLMGTGLPLATVFFMWGEVFPAYALFFLFGFGFGIADVACNVSGARLEEVERSSLMPTLHAGFSLGGIMTVLIGAVAEALRVHLIVHQIVVLGAVMLLGLSFSRRIGGRHKTSRPGFIRARAMRVNEKVGSYHMTLRPPRGLLIIIGFIAFVGSLAGGVSADWIPIAFIEVYDLKSHLAVLVLTLMFGGELLARLFGSSWVDRFGRHRTLRGTLTLAVIGILLVSLATQVWLAVLGALLWGLGVALALPIAVSATGSLQGNQAKNVAVVTAFSYSCYVLGPVALGLFADNYGFRVTFLVLAGLVFLSLLTSKAAR